jgi:hypothetical protein
VPIGSADFLTYNHFDAEMARELRRLQRAGDAVVVGDRDDAQVGGPGDMFQQLRHPGRAVAGSRMHMQVGFVHLMDYLTLLVVSCHS